MGHLYGFVSNSTDGVFAVDRRQAIVLWNDAATEIFGFTSEEVLGKKCYGVVCGRDDSGCIVCRRGCDAITSARHLQPPPKTDIEARTKDGGDVWLSVSTVVVPSRRKDLSVLVHLFREITREHDVLGAALNLATVVSGVFSRKPMRHSRRDFGRAPTCIELTRREREILTLLAKGASTDAIVEKLSISHRTVGNHVSNILSKLDLHSRLEAVIYAIKTGVV